MLVVYEKASGIIQRVSNTPDIAKALGEIPADQAGIVTDDLSVQDDTHWVNNGVITEYSEQGKAKLTAHPGPGFVWSAPTETWTDVRELEEVQAAAWAKIKALRLHYMDVPAVSQNGIKFRIVKDKGNLNDILETRRAAQVPSSILQKWRDEDDVYHYLDQAGLDALVVAMGVRGQAIYDYAWELETLVGAATTKEEVESILQDAVWP